MPVFFRSQESASDKSRLKVLRTGADDSASINAGAFPPSVHIHIPKCAGTTFDWVMIGVARALSRPTLRFEGTIYGQTFAGKDKSEAWRWGEGSKHPQDWLYASGHVPFGRFRHQPAACRTVTIIRDPIARLVSMYQMGVKRGVWDAATPVSELFGARHFVPNSMVRQLSGEISGTSVLGSQHVEAALHNFQSSSYRGRIEDFDSILGAIVGDYGFAYVAYHSWQVGEPIDDHERNRLAAAFAPYVDLDQSFFSRAVSNCGVQDKTAEISIKDIPPNVPVLFVSPHLVSETGDRIRSTVTTVQSLAKILGQ